MINNYQGIPITSEYYNEFRFWPEPIKITSKEEYNNILTFIYRHCRETTLTKNGHMCKRVLGNKFVYLGKSYSYIKHLVLYDGKMYQFQFWPGYDKKKPKGSNCLKQLRELGKDWIGPYLTAKKDDILAEKAKTLKPLIRIVDAEPGKTYYTDNDGVVIHLDLNSAYPAAVATMIPESRSTWEELYIRKKNGDAEAKDIMNLAIGAGQSEHIIGYRCPIMRRYAVNWTNEQLLWQAAFIKHKCNGQVLLFNTDGIWLKIPVYEMQFMMAHSKLKFGDELGQWKVDHIVTKFRIKSAGSYEYVENDVYHPVCRGIKKEISDTFQWGDIFNHIAKVFKFDKFITEVDIDEVDNYEEETFEI